jgi:hypothetical protein
MPAQLLAMLLALVGCTQTGEPDRGRQAPALARPAPPARPSPDAGAAMTNLVRDKLPSPFDVRVQRALAAPLGDDVAIAFDHVAMAKSPKTNYRFTVTTDGSVFYVQRSNKPGDWQVPFDQPLPGKPARKLEAGKLDALLARLASAGFFDHPGYEADPGTEDGSYWIVRARRGKDVHAVVYQNVQPAFFADLTAISDPLWVEPK